MSKQPARVCLFHAVRTSIEPIETAFRSRWADCPTFNLVDDSLAPDLAIAKLVTPALTKRFLSLAEYAVGCGASGILYTCSAFGPAIDDVRGKLSVPVLAPNEAMIDEALDKGTRLHVLATFAPAIASAVPEIEAAAARQSKRVSITTQHVPDALVHLLAGRRAEHDQLVVEAVGSIKDVDIILLVQFALAHTKSEIEQRTGISVLTTPESAVDRMRQMIDGALPGKKH